MFQSFLSPRRTPVSLTLNQQTTLKADILADPVLAAQKDTPDGRFAIAAAYNLFPQADFWVWKSSVTKNEAVNTASVDNTVFSWSLFIALTVQQQGAWGELWGVAAVVNPSLSQVRAGFQAVFPSGANLTHLSTIARRKATRAEKLFASGSGSTGAPATMAFENNLTFADVDAALNLP